VAELVFAAGVPHNPFTAMALANGAGGSAALEAARLYGAVAERLRAARPDVIVIFTNDHYNAFFDVCVPIFSICTADRAPGPSDYEQLPQFDVGLDPQLARELQDRLVAAEFDVGASPEISLDHTICAPLGLMVPRMDIPLVPFFISCSTGPRPSGRRCRNLGATLRAALQASELPRRVALVASGAFSFEVGGPRISEHAHFGVPAPGWCDRVVELISRAQVDRLVAEATPDQLERAGNASGEILPWLVVLGALGDVAPDHIEPQREEGHAFAAWSLGG
jgi:aromatic ring-opening dioxygenase catalytic subunit (LigB family)